MTQVSLYLFFLSRTNLMLHINVTLKLVKKFIINFDSSKASAPDCILVVALKIFVPELSYILAEHLNMGLEESCFPNYWKVSFVVPVFKNVRERSVAKNDRAVNLLYVLGKKLLT